MKSWIAIGLVVVGLAVAAPVGCGIMSTVATVATAPSRVINKTLQTDNIINNYEWFHDAYATYRARTRQIADHKAYMRDNTDPTEKHRLHIELSAMKQSCREISTRYNANATKTNRSIFMGREAPESLPEGGCE